MTPLSVVYSPSVLKYTSQQAALSWWDVEQWGQSGDSKYHKLKSSKGYNLNQQPCILLAQSCLDLQHLRLDKVFFDANSAQQPESIPSARGSGVETQTCSLCQNHIFNAFLPLLILACFSFGRVRENRVSLTVNHSRKKKSEDNSWSESCFYRIAQFETAF